jgi:two-component system OmpR family response regulator
MDTVDSEPASHEHEHEHDGAGDPAGPPVVPDAVPDAVAVADAGAELSGASMAVSGRRILVVDDEESITDLVAMSLNLHGANVEVAHSGTAALRAVETFRPHLVILDVMLPDLDGFEVLSRMGQDRRTAMIPVLFLTARGDLNDRLRGLSAGGDDYMTKPFSIEEMLLRITAVLRRTDGFGDVGFQLQVGDIVLDEESHEVWRGVDAVELTPTEFRLLHYLMINAGHVVSKAQIRDWVWDYSFEGKVNMVEVYISYLRKKLDRSGPQMIRTVRGIGYCLRATAAPSSGADGRTGAAVDGPDTGGTAGAVGREESGVGE